MTNRAFQLLMCAAGIALVLSGGAAAGRETSTAAKSGPMYDLIATSRHVVKGYKLAIEVDSNSQRQPEVLLDVTLSRTVGIATQSHNYSFRLPAFDCAPKLVSCMRLRTRNLMAPYGTLSMRFVPRGEVQSVPVDFPSCTGQKTQRDGALVGSVLFKPHNAALPGYRGTFRIPARVSSETLYTCTPKPQADSCHLSGLLGFNGASTQYFNFVASATGAPQLAVVHEGHKLPGRRWAAIGHTLFYTAFPADAFTATPDLTRAHVDATGLPFLTGSADYTSDGTTPTTVTTGCGTEQQTSGLVTGDVTAHFDGLPPRPVTPLAGVLWRRP